MNLKSQSPKALDDFAFSEANNRLTLEKNIKYPILMPGPKKGILLYGEYGTGKTELAKVLPNLFNESRPQTSHMYVNGGHFDFISCQHTYYSNQLSTVKTIKQRPWSENKCGLHFVIFDEIDNYSKAVQRDLKGIMTDSIDTVFVITTNRIGDVDSGIQNRCVILRHSIAEDQEWLRVMRRWAIKDGINFADAELNSILTSQSSRSARDISMAYANAAISKLTVPVSALAATP